MALVIDLVGDQFSKDRGRIRYHVQDAASAGQAYDLALAAAPAVYKFLIRQDCTVEELGPGLFECDVVYGTREAGEEYDVTWSFEIGTQNVHVTHAAEHIKDYPNGTDRDHKGAIGVRKEPNGGFVVEGTDVHLPIFSWEETVFLPYSLVTSLAWIQTMEALVATVNAASFRIWNRGELLLLGVSGAKQGNKPVPVTFRYASSRTRTGLSVGEITGIDKEGWHYAWVEYAPKENTSALTNRPVAVHVERLYEYGNWSAIPGNSPWN